MGDKSPKATQKKNTQKANATTKKATAASTKK